MIEQDWRKNSVLKRNDNAPDVPARPARFLVACEPVVSEKSLGHSRACGRSADGPLPPELVMRDIWLWLVVVRWLWVGVVSAT